MPALTSTVALRAHLSDHAGQASSAGDPALTRASTGQALTALVQAGLDQLPLPGQGRTLLRWQLLAMVAAHDLSLVKLFEGHTDALAIMAELDAPPCPLLPEGQAPTWGVWCAEPPEARLQCARPDREGRVQLHGKKSWCSGAAVLSHALVSAWNEAGEPCLVAVELAQAGVGITDQGWQAVGMVATGSVDVWFKGARGRLVGHPGSYVSRPGFWQGGAGIAACWYGAAEALGEAVRAAGHARMAKPEPHQLAHLGQIDVALSGARAVLHGTARWIDDHPVDNARPHSLRARLAAEDAALRVLQHAGRALGAGPLCRDARIARLVADLPVFVRQSHAERDLAALGLDLAGLEGSPWRL